jgi:hypothetical protein
MFFPDDGVRVPQLSEYVGRRVAAKVYARMLSDDAQFRVVSDDVKKVVSYAS